MDVRSDTLFLAEIGLPKLDPPQIGLVVIFKNTTKLRAWVRNPQVWSYAHPRFLGKGHPQPSGAAILNSGVPMALNLRSSRRRNHAHDFNFLENLKIWSHSGPRSIAHLLRTLARLNRYPRISDAGGFT